jgi:HD-like signal output (HDOD) protein
MSDVTQSGGPQNELIQRVLNCPTLPTLPAAALHVLQIMDDAKTSVEDLAEVISKDPALSVKVLRTINSSLYGLPQRVTSLAQAVSLLGLHSVKTLVLGFSLMTNLRNRPTRAFNHLQYWRRSMYAAVAARVIASKVLPGTEEQCFITALLMDIGALALDQALGEAYSEVLERAESHADLSVVELHALGSSHAEVGGALAGHWKLPHSLAAAIEHHHSVKAVEEQGLRQITQVVWLAGRCADVFADKSAAESIVAVRQSFGQLYNFNELDADALLCLISRKTMEVAELFEVRLNAANNYESILAKATQRVLELSIAQGGPDIQNRRKANRIRRDGKILILPCTNGIVARTIEVRLKDVSASGIGLIHTQPMKIGDQFIVRLREKNAEPKNLLYKVTRCDLQSSMASIGAELSAVLKEEPAPANVNSVAA